MSRNFRLNQMKDTIAPSIFAAYIFCNSASSNLHNVLLD